MILSNGREIFQRREQNSKQLEGRRRSSPSGNWRRLAKRKLVWQGWTEERRTGGFARGFGGKPGGQSYDLGPKPDLRKIRTAEGRVLARELALSL